MTKNSSFKLAKCVFAISCCLIYFSPVLSHGQLKVEVDEDVKVFYFREWRDGIVVDKKGNKILVEFEFAASSNQEVFGRKDIHRLYEHQGLDFGRNWESTNGKFKVEAAILGLDGDKVRLMKTDFNEIKVPLSKLSQKDNSYVNKFLKKMKAEIKQGTRPAPSPDLPEIENFENFGSSLGFETEGEEGFTKLAPTPSYLKNFKQAGMGFNLIRKRQKLIAVIPVGGPDQLVLMSFREKNPFDTGDLFQSQLYWVSLKKKKVVNFVSITHEDYAIDYNPRHKLLLTYNRSEEFGGAGSPDHYTIWKMMPGAETAEPIIRWAGKGMSWAQTLFGKVVNDHIVVVKTDRSQYEAFDIKEKKVVYTLNTESFFDAPVVISHDRQNLIVPEDGGVSILNAVTGKFKFTASVDERHVSGANVNESGTKLAALTERNVYVWDLESEDSEPQVFPAPLMGSPFQSRIEWIDDDNILGESHTSRVLYRLSEKLAIWSYEMDVRQSFLNKDPLTNMVIDGKFFYVAQPDVWGGSIAVGAVDLPGPSVNEVTSSIDRDSLMVVKAGVKVGLEMDGITEPDKVKKWLLAKFEENGWIYDSSSDLVLHAKMGVNSTEKVSYEEWGTGKISTVNFKPHVANIKIKRDDQIIWQTGTSSGPPPFVRVRQGSSVQSKVDDFSKSQIGFFKTVRIDEEIIDPRYSRGFGKSILGLRGIRVASTSPPGREDDPFAADRKAQEDRVKAADEEGKENEPGQGGAGQDRPGPRRRPGQ